MFVVMCLKDPCPEGSNVEGKIVDFLIPTLGVIT